MWNRIINLAVKWLECNMPLVPFSTLLETNEWKKQKVSKIIPVIYLTGLYFFNLGVSIIALSDFHTTA